MNPPKICVLGSSNVDMITRVPRPPIPGETLIGNHFNLAFGGKGANQAVMASRLGATVHMITKVGQDSFGVDLIKNFQENHIDTTHVLIDTDCASGVAQISVDESTGQNAIVIVPGANATITPSEVRNAKAVIQASDLLIGQLEIPITATLEGFRAAKEHDATRTLLNPAPAQPLSDELLHLTDVLIPNELEAAQLTGSPTKTIEQAIDAARILQRRGVHTIIVTLGERGALLVDSDMPPVHIPSKSVRAVDTTGAGDAFVGSFAFYWLTGHSPLEAVQKATVVAVRSVLRQGAQTSYPHPAELTE